MLVNNRHLRQDVADDLREGGKDTHAHPARRTRSARPHRQRVRAAAGARGSRGPGGDGGIQGVRPRHYQAPEHASGHGAQPRLVQPLHLRRRGP